ncbi:MAG: class I SAM-dependent methyltransferase [Phototrophicales bacterium]|nr:MAG: class I SAM-dependent methyltransferase [Phototrophicales bacterium]
MVNYREIYQTRAEAYEQLIRLEDHASNIEKTLYSIIPTSTQHIVEFGAGTGRITRLIAKKAMLVTACDQSIAMLKVAQLNLRQYKNCHLIVADNRQMPLDSQCADVAIAGWSFGHSIGWYPETWQHEIEQALRSMQRILKPKGLAIIIETLGTGSAQPNPPNTGLAAYYHWLENTHHFQRQVIRTDYRFSSPQEGADKLRFFFGDELADRIVHEQLTLLPEWTGIWTRYY